MDLGVSSLRCGENWAEKSQWLYSVAGPGATTVLASSRAWPLHGAWVGDGQQQENLIVPGPAAYELEGHERTLVPVS